jgi:thioredoxin 1
MKRMVILLLMFFLMSVASLPVAISSKGINFFDGSLDQAMLEAKSQTKPVFVYVYASWCGQCKKLKKSFKDEDTGTYFNKHFINVSVDGETAEGSKVLARYGVKAYPTLLILDQSGKMQTKTTGYLSPYLLINFGKRIVPAK